MKQLMNIETAIPQSAHINPEKFNP